MAVRLTRFKCWWCARLLGVKRLHHETQSGVTTRRCCYECYMSADSHYRRVYKNEIAERQEVRRVRSTFSHWHCKNCEVFFTDDEVLDSREGELSCMRCKADLYPNERGSRAPR